jgi:arylsulfatase A-like enzyme
VGPNIDRLAQRGTLFSNTHTPVPVCNGARTAVLTGLAPSTTGIYSDLQDWRLTLPQVVTLPEYFHNNGYEVVGGAKFFTLHLTKEKPLISILKKRKNFTGKKALFGKRQLGFL